MKTVRKVCPECSGGFDIRPGHAAKRVYCSRACMARGYSHRLRGKENPHFSEAGARVCETCQVSFVHYNRRRRFCSIACRDRSDFYHRGRSKKDLNHDAIAAALLSAGAQVIETHLMSHGAPDLIVGANGATILMEIKNPATGYGLSPAQQAFHAGWPGGKLVVVRSVEEALSVIGLAVAGSDE